MNPFVTGKCLENSGIIWDSGDYFLLLLKRFTKMTKMKTKKTHSSQTEIGFSLFTKKNVFTPLSCISFLFPWEKRVQEKHITQKEPGLKENNKIK